MKFCMVGYGSIAEFHRDALQQLGGAQIDCVMGRLLEPARGFAKSCGAEFATTNLTDALKRPGLDAVLITSPSQVHYRQTKAALNAGKHVLLEIPMSLKLAHAEELCDLADRAGKVLMICHTQRYWESTFDVRRRVGAGELTPYHFHVEWHFFRRENINWMGRRRSWTDNLLWHHGGHVIDLAIWLFGEEPVVARALFGPADNPLGIPLDLSAQMRFPSGRLATFALTYNAMVDRPIQVGTLVCKEDTLKFQDGTLSDHRGALLIGQKHEEAIPRQNREFLEAVRTGREPLSSGRSMLPSYRALHQMERSARSVR